MRHLAIFLILCSNLNAALIMHLKMDEATDVSGADSIVDEQGSHPGTPDNPVISVAGQDGTAISFNGGAAADDKITVGDDAALDMSRASWTFTGWIYPKSDGGNNVGRIFIKTNHLFFTSNEDAGVSVKLQAKVDAVDGMGQDATSILNAGIAINTWHYATLTFDGTDLVIYINGLAPAQTQQGFGTGDPTDNRLNDLLISAVNSTFDGFMDDMRFYNTALSAGDVLALFNSYSETETGRYGGAGRNHRRSRY